MSNQIGFSAPVTKRWTHSMCVACWIEKNPGRFPHRLIGATKEKCCFCGGTHESGIYVRQDQDEIQCKGKGGIHG